MMCYSVQSSDRIFGKAYGFLSFAKNIGKNIGKNISQNLSGKYCQKLIDHAKESATGEFKKASKTTIQKTAETTGDLIGKAIADKITKVSKTLQQNNSQTITNEHDKEIPKERYISPEEKQKIIDDLRSI